MARILKKCIVVNRSGYPIPGKVIKTIKKHQFRKVDKSVGGEAPKDILRIYQYDGVIRKDNYKTWPIYIVKIGQKWYPNESITEQLITDIGKEIGVNVTSSILLEIEGVIRFSSKHFHSDNQILYHGAEILSRYLDQPDEGWIEDLEKHKMLKEFIHVEDVISSLKHQFENYYGSILNDFIDMVLFDCFVGNNDRHYYNWGVITDIIKKQSPYFSPIYDTARGLWWNVSDHYLVNLFKDTKSKSLKVESYVKNSTPKITIPGDSKCNHFELINHLQKKGYISDNQVIFWKNRDNVKKIINVIDDKYYRLMIPERREIIKETLTLRFSEMLKILK